jgi:oxidase EvaA
MAEQVYLDWFRERLAHSQTKEARDPQEILKWRDSLVAKLAFSAELIGLSELRGWTQLKNGNVVHDSSQFFSIEGVRISDAGQREVKNWDQPIYNQLEGGVLAMVARERPQHGIEFLLQAKAEPGNIGWLQLCPSIQCTWSNLRRAHRGKMPPLTEIMLLGADRGVRQVYRAQHNEEGGRFWRKSNENILYFVSDDSVIKSDLTYFRWASFTQIKNLALLDNVLSPFVKTIICPL